MRYYNVGIEVHDQHTDYVYVCETDARAKDLARKLNEWEELNLLLARRK